jgi:molybdate transport system substrate-binding protein
MKKTLLRLLCSGLVYLNPLQTLEAEEVNIAVAVNFTAPLREITNDFSNSSGHTVKITAGSTGQLYAEIRSGSSFDVFLAADQRRPHMLEIDSLASGRFTYAIGKLVLWHKEEHQLLNDAVLKQGKYAKLALANPKLAPYGAAAIAVMERLNMDKSAMNKWIIGEDLNETYQYVSSGAAEMGFIAMSQLLLDNRGSYWEIPQSLYDPLRQDAVLLTKGQNNPAANAFMDYLKTPQVRVILDKYGYMRD